MSLKCICHICNCGRHKCPVHPKAYSQKQGGPCPLSEYSNKYIVHPMGLPTQSMKPTTEAFSSGAPLEDHTTHKVDYVPHPLAAKELRKGDEWIPPQGEFDFTSNYRKEYTEKRPERVAIVKQEAAKRKTGPFEGEPTYRRDYRQWPVDAKPVRTVDTGYRPSDQPFSGETTFQHDYHAHQIPPRENFKPPADEYRADAPFNDATDHRQSYVRHPLPPKAEKKRDVYQRKDQPFEGMTTFQRDYTQHPLDKIFSFKPDQEGYRSDAPFDDRTTFKTDYKKWPTERQKPHADAEYVAPAGDFDFTTTHKTDFTKHPNAAQNAAKRPTDKRAAPGPFEGNPTYRDDYRQWPSQARQKPVSKPDYIPPSAPFQGNSQYQTQFVPHTIDKMPSFKPDIKIDASAGPFEDHTTYRTDYIPKRSEICPAATLETTGSNWQFAKQDETGHKFYQPKGLKAY